VGLRDVLVIAGMKNSAFTLYFQLQHHVTIQKLRIDSIYRQLHLSFTPIMYIRPVHAELDVPTLHAFVQKYSLGLLTTSIQHPEHATLQTTHIPFVLDRDIGEKGTLRGHMARANPQTKAIIAVVQGAKVSAKSEESSDADAKDKHKVTNDDGIPELADEVLILFNAPVHHYVTPKFYVETKPSTHKTVPTWNYAAVQVYGRAKIYHLNDDQTSAFLQTQIEDLSQQHEERQNPEKPWKVGEAPESYVSALKKAIIGGSS
jgi:transcriptional regulator